MYRIGGIFINSISGASSPPCPLSPLDAVKWDIRNVAAGVNATAVTAVSCFLLRVPLPIPVRGFLCAFAAVGGIGAMPESRAFVRRTILPPYYGAMGPQEKAGALEAFNRQLDESGER